MSFRKRFIGHLKVVTKHRWEVFKAMKDCGYLWRGLTHDLSKFNPTEFWEGVKYFQGNRSPIEACKEDKGYSMAWFHHRGRNPHHSQYWCDISFGEIIPCDIPWKYLIEFICDGVAAGKTYLGDKWTQSNPIEYWKSRDSKSFFSENTRKKIEWYYTVIGSLGWDITSRIIKIYGDVYELEKSELYKGNYTVVTLPVTLYDKYGKK